MKQILRSDWLPEQGTWVHLAHSGFPALVPREKVPLLAMKKSHIDQAESQDGWILVWFFFCVFIDLDLANIQPLTLLLVNNAYSIARSKNPQVPGYQSRRYKCAVF